MAVKLARNNVCGVIKISDGTTPPEEIELQFDNGNLSITFGGEETHILYDRDEISGAVKGKQLPSDISFEADFVELYKEAADADPTPFEVFYMKGGAVARKAAIDIGGTVAAGVLSYEAKTPGAAGNSISIWHKAGAAESISVVGTDIEIVLESGVSSAASIKALVEGTPAAAALVSVAIKTAGVLDDEAAAIDLVNGWDGWLSRMAGNKHLLKVTWEITNPDSTGEDEVVEMDNCYVEPGGISITENEETNKIAFKLKSLASLPDVSRT